MTVDAYNRARYELALSLLRTRVAREPLVLPGIITHIWFYERVLASVLNDHDREQIVISYEFLYASSPKRFLLSLRGRKPQEIRCKWCGHYTRVARQTHSDLQNFCESCSCKYPWPDFEWDKPELMALSEGRGSWEPDSENSRIWNEWFDRAVAEGIFTTTEE